MPCLVVCASPAQRANDLQPCLGKISISIYCLNCRKPQTGPQRYFIEVRRETGEVWTCEPNQSEAPRPGDVSVVGHGDAVGPGEVVAPVDHVEEGEHAGEHNPADHVNPLQPANPHSGVSAYSYL